MGFTNFQIATATALLSEKKQHYSDALKQIEATIKDCTIVWRNRKPHLVIKHFKN